ncbi:MAG: aminotransferase class I/II-fold pyridoxal phosphate-dependent enzyme [Thermoleophilaceae bacterium]|nr:aminotransferase class I/II-fold pyridoxal phosphate-dependent enzyme [Thermoleophilaceae bacterium]
MGLLDYYRQFDDLSEEEVNRGLRARSAREKAVALERVSELDLAGTEWPDFPDAEVMNAAIFAARGNVNGYPDRAATVVREALAERHGVDLERIAFGNGSTELLQAAALRLLREDDELVTPWPSYPLYPLMAHAAGARPVPVESVAAIGEAVGPRTRIAALCNPNDPTGTYTPAATIEGLAASLPEHVHLLVDEAYVQFQDVEPADAVLRLTDSHPRVIVFRTFSKIYGLSGLRAGYAVGSSEAGPLLAAIAPVLGVNALTQAGVAHALKIGDPEIARRRDLVIEQRARLLAVMPRTAIDAQPSEANFLRMSSGGLSGAELSARLLRQGIRVAHGDHIGERQVRVAIRGAAATGRLITALETF